MSALAVTYPKSWNVDTDDEGHRDYTLVWPVHTTSVLDGPDIATSAAGLPLPGAYLNIGSTVNTAARYNRKGGARLIKEDGNRKLWQVTTVFSTRPLRRCSTSSFDDPLMEPHRVRGGFNKVNTESNKDKDDKPLLNSAGQRFRGTPVQDVTSRPTVELEMNVSWIDLAFLAQYVEAVNDGTWWSMPARTIKCTDFQWEQVLYGTCYHYFHVTFTFELNDLTWDLSLLDEGDMVKIPGTAPPEYRRAKDRYEELIHVLLDGDGNALAAGATEVYLPFRVKRELDFAAVGWPASLL